ncbi:MAG TPA: hypothetical protein VH079_02710 [Terriglobales bacterium]|jgi:hypothetical protein|nr:hypothetical protein [Terriglobales bacterium]
MLLRRTRLVTLIIAAFLLTGAAFADSTVSMAFIGPGGNNGGGVYTYPYNFSINGGASTSLICDAFDNEVVAGETWTANESSLLGGNGLWGSQLTNYKEAGLIFQGILSGNIDATAGNWAIWGLFSSNAQSNSFFASSGAAAIDAQYLNAAMTDPDSAFNGFVLYTPVSWSGGEPQEYIGYNPSYSAPEPGSLLLCGMAFATIGAGLFGKFRRPLAN